MSADEFDGMPGDTLSFNDKRFVKSVRIAYSIHQCADQLDRRATDGRMKANHTSVDDETGSAAKSVLIGDGADGFSSDLLDFLTPPTRSLARRDHDSRRLCASQQAAGPRPLIVSAHADRCLLQE